MEQIYQIKNIHKIFAYEQKNNQIEIRLSNLFQITAFIILIDLMNEEALQQNSIIYLSAGFDGPFVLQAFSVRKLPLPTVGLQMCLTDGKVYIGAKYNSAEYPEVQDYWLVEVTAKFISQSQPIIIKTLQVVSTYPRKLLGSPPCTLIDHFNKETARTGQQRLSEPSKKIKYSNTFDMPLLKNSDNKKPAQKQKQSAQFGTISPNIYKRKQESKAKPESQKKTNEKKLKIADSEQEYQEGIVKKENPKPSTKKQNVENHHSDDETLNKNLLIADLYQRRPGWVILCRINYLNKVNCVDGKIAHNFMLADEVGDEIKCVYFENPLDAEEDILQVDKYYSFSEGEVAKAANKNDGTMQLQINFDRNAVIIPRNNIEFAMNLSKFCRISAIPMKEANSEISVIGMIKSMKFVDMSNKNKLKFSSTICDPISGYEIDLLLFLNAHEKPPQKGAIGFLHNYQLFKQNNVCRLNSNYKSYFREEKAFKDELTSQFKRIKQERDWEHMFYKNLSSVPFSFRTIRDLKRIINSTDDEKVFSLIDCWVLDVSKKKFYHACKNCKKGTDKKDSGVFYCQNCGRNVDTFHCFTLTANFADFTSNLTVDVIGEHAETLMQLKSIQFFELASEKQLQHLDSLRTKNVTLKLKTERRDNKRQSHSVWAIQNSSASNSLKEIRRKLEERKVKIDEKW